MWVNLHFYEGPRQREKWQDADNLAKAVLDALNDVAYTDDRNIVSFKAQVERNDARPRVDIVLYYDLVFPFEKVGPSGDEISRLANERGRISAMHL